MELFPVALVVATFLCALVAGFLFAFAVVAMPGLSRLGDAAFIRAFQHVDGVIRQNQPLFMLVWVGSVVSLVVAVGLGVEALAGSSRLLLLGAALVYLLGVQLPTFVVNVPLNNRLQTLNAGALDAAALREARRNFEPRWNRWNVFRTALSSLSALLLIALLFIL
ncbi:anthrone oxygenase family protein [Rhodocaloribacter sp.]